MRIGQCSIASTLLHAGMDGWSLHSSAFCSSPHAFSFVPLTSGSKHEKQQQQQQVMLGVGLGPMDECVPNTAVRVN